MLPISTVVDYWRQYVEVSWKSGWVYWDGMGVRRCSYSGFGGAVEGWVRGRIVLVQGMGVDTGDLDLAMLMV